MQSKRLLIDDEDSRIAEIFPLQFCVMAEYMQDELLGRDPRSLSWQEMVDIAERHAELFRVH
ncbi:MAG TPA: hypothetical protein VFN81_09335 [Sphingomicrobium sp.]|nr:hypothetical protein [Sphingomicrobium sp.]